MPTAPLPQTGDAQEIGQDAVDCLVANKPRSWVLSQLPDDYGLDFQVQLKVQQQLERIFRLQLKGTRSPELNASGDFFSVALSASTLRYYNNIEEPILLVLCDLSVDPLDPRNCPSYYTWLRPELHRVRIDEVDPNQEEVTLRVPKANLLTRTTDLLPDVRRAHELAEVGHALDVQVAIVKPALDSAQRVSVVRGIEQGLSARSVAFIDAIADTPDDFWIAPAPGTLSWILTEARRHLNAGRLPRCAQALDQADSALSGATALELAEYWHLRGRLRSASGDLTGATLAFKKAVETHASPRYRAAWAESELRLRYHPEQHADFADIIEALSGEDPQTLAIKARLLAASGRDTEALALLDTFEGPDNLSARAVIRTMRSEPQEALAACVSGLNILGLRESTRNLFLVLKARARFNLALSGTEARTAGGRDEFLPPSGPIGLDPDLLRQAWHDIEEAVEMMEDTAWIANGEFVVDMWVATASMLGKQGAIFPSLRALAEKRPHIAEIQSALETTAAQIGEFGAALEANARLPRTATQILRRVAFLHESKQHGAVVALVEVEIANLDKNHQLFGPALTMAAQSAHALARFDLVGVWSALLDETPHLAADGAVLQYFLARAENGLGGDEPLHVLQRRDLELGHPFSTTAALFQQLDPTDPSQSLTIVEVGARLRTYVRLAPSIAMHLALAMVSLEQWEALLSLCEEAEHEFDVSPRLRAIKALALDKLGNTEAARGLLKEMVEAGLSDSVALNTYTNISVRWGYVDEAIQATERILERATERSTKLQCLRLLFNLTQTADPNSARLVNLAFRMGELVDQNDEAEEGVFLSMVLVATSLTASEPTVQKREELTARSERFFARFPNSKILKRTETSPNATAEELLQSVNAVIGGPDESQQQFHIRVERQLQQGVLPIPYAWRPRRALRGVHDIVHLWELTKASTADDRKYHLVMMSAQWGGPIPVADLRSKIPLVDLPTLLILRDLELLDHLFDFFPKIAIAHGTLTELMRLSQLFSGSLWRGACLELQTKLRSRAQQILQPHKDVELEHSLVLPSSEEIRLLCQQGGLLLYADDLLFRMWCYGANDPPPGMCTMDFLLALEQTGRLTTVEVARKIAQLCAWHVGMQILINYQLAIVPVNLPNVREIDEGVDLLQQTPDFMAMANAMWDFRSDFSKGLLHVSDVLGQLVSRSTTAALAIASFIGVWYVKSKLRREAPHPPLKILTRLIVLSVTRLGSVTEEVSRRLWAVFGALVEFEHGRHMDENREKEANQMLAAEAAHFDLGMAEKGIRPPSSCGDRLLLGLTPDTAGATAFSTAYAAALIARAAN